MQPTGTVLNGPVFRVNRSLNLLDIGTLAPTIPPDEYLGTNPGIRTAYFKMHPGYYNDQPVVFLAREHAPGQISHAPGAIPVPTLRVSTLGSAGFARFYTVDGQSQPPVIDSIPIPIQQVTAVTGNGTPVYSGTTSTAQPSNAPLYSPIWSVFAVTFNPGVTAQPLRSVQEIQQAVSAGLVTVANGRPDDTFNCPVPFYYQSGTAGSSPVYIPPVSTTTNPAAVPGYIAPGTTNTNPMGNTTSPSPPSNGGTPASSPGTGY